MRTYGIIAGVVVVVLIGALFYFAGQADSKRPAQVEVRVPATNVGVQPQSAGGGPTGGQ